MTGRFHHSNHFEDKFKLVKDGRFTGIVHTRPDRLSVPLKHKKPKVWAIWSDLFHWSVDDEFIDKAFAVMALSQQHTFLILTKRPERMHRYFHACDDTWKTRVGAIQHHCDVYYAKTCPEGQFGEKGSGRVIVADNWPLHNVWLGIPAENQEQADSRVPILLRTLAANRFVNIEPMLGPIDIERSMAQLYTGGGVQSIMSGHTRMPRINLVILGGETGPGARLAHASWMRFVSSQCDSAGIDFFLKSMGTAYERIHGKGAAPVGLSIGGKLPWRENA
jgi:protein gp37